MSRYLIGLTDSSLSLIQVTKSMSELLHRSQNTSRLRLPTLWTYQSLIEVGVDALHTGSIYFRGPKEEKNVVFWNVSISSPHAISAGNSLPPLATNHFARLEPSHFNNHNVKLQSLTIAGKPIKAYDYETYEVPVRRTRMMVDAVIDGALFERIMPENAHNFSVQCSHTKHGRNHYITQLFFFVLHL